MTILFTETIALSPKPGMPPVVFAWKGERGRIVGYDEDGIHVRTDSYPSIKFVVKAKQVEKDGT